MSKFQEKVKMPRYTNVIKKDIVSITNSSWNMLLNLLAPEMNQKVVGIFRYKF